MKSMMALLGTTTLLCANSLLVYTPSSIGFLPSSYQAEIDYYIKEQQSSKLEGITHTQGGDLPTSSHSKPQVWTPWGLYVISPLYGQWRFGIAYHPDLVDSRFFVYNDPVASLTSHRHTIDYTTLSLTAAYGWRDDVWTSLGLNLVHAYGEKEAYRRGIYDLSMTGDVTVPSLTGSLTWRIAPWLFWSLTGSTHTPLTLKGEAQGSLLGQNFSTTAHAKTMLPAELETLVTTYFSPTTSLTLGMKKRFWNEANIESIQMDDPTINQTLGTTKPAGVKDVTSYRLFLKESRESFEIMLGYIKANAVNKPEQEDFTSHFTSDETLIAQCALKVSPSTQLGLRHIRQWQRDQTIDNTFFTGAITTDGQQVTTLFWRSLF